MKLTNEQKAQSWCFENGYYVDVLPQTKGRKPLVKLNVLKGRKILKKGEKLYAQDEKLSLIIQKVYVYLFNKFSEN
tara:strand:+ start:330 stop:557 length:228 start_codon:yes stop_codon:yes gene_type:complete